MFINFIIDLLLLKDYNVIWVVINRLIKKRYYVLYITKDNNIFIKNIIKMLIKKKIYIYELLILIMFNRGSQFVIII